MEGNNEVINLISDDEEDNAFTSRAQPPKRPRHSPLPPPPPPPPPPGDDDDDIVVVSHVRKNDRTKSAEQVGNEDREIVETPVTTPSKAAPALDGGDDDDELVVVTSKAGVQANVNYPHNRFSCGVKPFGRGVRVNRLFCPKCYCYVCDKPASECLEWSSHCSATDKSPKWRAARARARPKPPPAIKKKTSFFVSRPRGAQPANRFSSQFLGGGNRSLMNPISPVSFQDSVLAIIGNPNRLRHSALHQVASLRTTTPPVPPTNSLALDALDSALSLQWPQPPPPSLVPDSLLLPPLVNSQMRPGGASHSRRPKKSISAMGPIPSPSRTSLATSTPIVVSSNPPSQGNSALASPDTVMGSALASQNLIGTSVGVPSQTIASLPLNTVAGSTSTAAIRRSGVSLALLTSNTPEQVNSMIGNALRSTSSGPLLYNPPTPVTSSALAAYHSSITPATLGPLAPVVSQSAPVIPAHQNGPIPQPPPQDLTVQPQRNASIESVLDNTPLGSPTTSTVPKMPETPGDSQRLPPNKIPTLREILNDGLSSVDWSKIGGPNETRDEGSAPVPLPQSNASGISLTVPDRSLTPPLVVPENNGAPDGFTEQLPLPPITSIRTDPPSDGLAPFVPTPSSDISGATTSIPPLPSFSALPVPSETESTGTVAEKEKAKLFLGKFIPDDVEDNGAQGVPVGTVGSTDCNDQTENCSGDGVSAPLETNVLFEGRDGLVTEKSAPVPELSNNAIAETQGDLNSFLNADTVEPMEGISRPEDEPNMQRREPHSSGSSSPSAESPAVEERIRMRAQQVVMDPLRGLMTMGLEGNRMTLNDLGTALESGGGASVPNSSNPGN